MPKAYGPASGQQLDLNILYGLVESNQLDIASAISLVEEVVKNETDAPASNNVDIWQTVFELVVARINPTSNSGS